MIKTGMGKEHSVINKTCNRMIADILDGKFQPGERLPGDRELARIYDIGRSSMMRVLGILQEERYVERIPVYGTFIRNDIRNRFPIISLVFVTPDKSLSPETLGISSWSGIMEILRGIFDEASARPGVRTTMLYCEDTADQSKLKQQLEDLRRYDGVIFCGHLLTTLKHMFAAEGKPAIVVVPKLFKIPEQYPVIYFNAVGGIIRMAHYIAVDSPDRPVALLHWKPDTGDDCMEEAFLINQATSELKSRGFEPEDFCLNPRLQDNVEVQKLLEERYGELQCFAGKSIWCLNRKILPVLHYLLVKHRVDAKLYGAASSVEISNLFPPVPYLREPFHELGSRAAAMLAENCTNRKEIKNLILESELYCGIEHLNI